MKITTDKTLLLQALTDAQTVARKSTSTPILSHVLLSVQDTVQLRATDMEIWQSTTLADSDIEATGAITLSAKHFRDVIKTLPSGQVEIEALDNHWAKITAGRSQFKIMGMADRDFPAFPDDMVVDTTGEREEFGALAESLARLIDRTIYSVSVDVARPNLNGVLLEATGSIATMVSTDGHRITKSAGSATLKPLEKGITIPHAGLLAMRKVFSDCDQITSIVIEDGHLIVSTPESTLWVKLRDTQFPPYNQVIPDDTKNNVSVDRMDLITALRQAVVMAPERTATVKFDILEDLIRMTSDNPDIGTSTLEVSALYRGPTFSIGFNGTYLLQAIEHIETDCVLLGFSGELDPVTVTPDDAAVDHVAVVMPMRL